MGWLYLVLLAAAVAVVVGAEWPRLERRVGLAVGREDRRRRERERRKPALHVVRTETDDFAASVERDLAQLPTIDERDPR